ncbi:MAG TPA: TGS domain-containing protein [Deltaproteobacteria bacterium]|nr:TGS domain-containing protein [Deltaproteobacteria bacterium]
MHKPRAGQHQSSRRKGSRRSARFSLLCPCLTQNEELSQKLNYARIWGKTVHDGQMVQRDYVMNDGDIIEIHF